MHQSIQRFAHHAQATSTRIATALTAFALAIAPCMASAQQAARDVVAPSSDWHGAIGAGELRNPSYPGSDRDVSRVVPFAEVVWSDLISLGYDGFDVFWHHGDLRIGGGLTWDFGRSDAEKHSIFGNGDSRLRGLDNINASLGNQGFVSYRIANLNLYLSGTQYTGDLHKGILAKAGVESPFKVTQQLTLTPHLEAYWANSPYTDRYFGVTAAEATRSEFSTYTATGGWRNVAGGLKVQYEVARHWYLNGDFTGARYEGDAARSPLVLARSDKSWSAVLDYRY